jgi:hypothetical protein
MLPAVTDVDVVPTVRVAGQDRGRDGVDDDVARDRRRLADHRDRPERLRRGDEATVTGFAWMREA